MPKKQINPIPLIIIFIILLVIGLGIYFRTSKKTKVANTSTNNYEEIFFNEMPYYKWLTPNTWNGDYHKDTYSTSISNSLRKVVSYEDYLKYINIINDNILSKKISNHYKNKNMNYIIFSYASGFNNCNFELIDCVEENEKVIIYGHEASDDNITTNGSGYLVVIPTTLPVDTLIEYINCYSEEEINQFGTSIVPEMMDY